MELSKLVAHVNLVTDEEFEFERVVEWLNDAIAKMNVECESDYPYFDVLQPSTIHPLPVKWQRMLFVPFAAGRVKENDSSRFEYEDWYAQFFDNLRLFKSVYDIPEEYRDADYNNGSFPPSFTGNPMGGDW